MTESELVEALLREIGNVEKRFKIKRTEALEVCVVGIAVDLLLQLRNSKLLTDEQVKAIARGKSEHEKQVIDSTPRLRRITAAYAAKYIRDTHGVPCSPKTLAKLRCIGGGPAFYKAGRVPLYAEEDLDAWAESRLSRRVMSTSELAG